MKITVWNERAPEEQDFSVRKVYPQGMQQAIVDIFAGEKDVECTVSSQNLPDDGLSEQLLANTDVLFYWAHCLHDKLSDAAVERIAARVKEGMGVVFMHSAHPSKPFQKLMGTSGALRWREDGKHERVWTLNPNHPIAYGIGDSFIVPKDEMYGEYFDIPTPDDLIFMGWFPGGELFRSGFTYHYGEGKIFYFQPGHETFPVYYQDEIKKILFNAAMWVSPLDNIYKTRVNEPQKRKCFWHGSLEHRLFGRPKK